MKRLTFFLALAISSALAQGVDQELLRHWEYESSAPLSIQQLGVEIHERVKVYDITYRSPVGDRASSIGPKGAVVAAYLVVPNGKGPFPAVIYGHWCMPGSDKKNRTEFLAEALVLARSGVISLLPDHVSVRPGFKEDESPLNEQQFAVGIQQIINLRRGADLLLARKNVDPTRLAYVGHSCDAASGGFLSGLDKRFKALVLMAGNLSDDVDLKTPMYQAYRQKLGANRFDAFVAKYSWTDPAKYVSHAAPAVVFLQYASEEPFMTADMEKAYADSVSEPKRLKIYNAPHALNAEATRDRVAFLAEQLSFSPPDAKAVTGIPVLAQPPWPKMPQ